MNADPFDLQRFVTAQAASFEVAIGELQAGRKQSHWMWFIFPQLRGLGRSAAADYYGIAGLAEAMLTCHIRFGATPRIGYARRACLQ